MQSALVTHAQKETALFVATHAHTPERAQPQGQYWVWCMVCVVGGAAEKKEEDGRADCGSHLM